ncbi:ATP-binding protein [Herbaspirillum rhizosphaerae]|uniref:Signal transduction histidine-protein kinase/phosphatase MprB n=1 Tax=Herbaspirillum rhizosphaerae TaxID=346179 RepID=A0ABW8Z8Z7_9BURK
MTKAGLGHRIILSMIATAFFAILIVTTVLYSHHYYLVQHLYALGQPEWSLAGLHWSWLIATVLGLAVVAVTAIRLARHILTPVSSVTDSMRRLSQGDSAARARKAGSGSDCGHSSHSINHISQLVDEFNALAERLQGRDEQRIFWNAAVAHELRTPVTILQARLQGLADGVLQSDKSQYVSLLAQTENLSRLIDDLRVVALAECGHLALHLRDIDLASEVASVVELFREILRETGQDLVMDLEPGIVSCDPMRIRQALHALLDNVRRHAVKGKVRIQVKVTGERVCLRVEDDGPGISHQSMSKVFKAFYCVEEAGSGLAGGSGLGLAVVAEIARAHGGSAVCLPAPGGGTRFEMHWSPRSRASS